MSLSLYEQQEVVLVVPPMLLAGEHWRMTRMRNDERIVDLVDALFDLTVPSFHGIFAKRRDLSSVTL
jgi:hypothetical protein